VNRAGVKLLEFVGSKQAVAIKISSLSITSANPATIRICMPQWRLERVTSKALLPDLTMGMA
jgi:hypothetical protein